MKSSELAKLAMQMVTAGRPANEVWFSAEQVVECAAEIDRYKAGRLSGEELIHIVGRRTARRRARNHPDDAIAQHMASWYEGEPD